MFPMILFGIAAVVSVQPARCEHPDFSGTWQLDLAASDIRTMPVPVAGFLTITPSSHRLLHMQVIMRNPHGERTVETDWKTDNKFHPDLGDQSGEVLAKWEGSILVGTRLMENGAEEIRLNMTPGGASMVQTIQSNQGLSTLVWRRSATGPVQP